MFLADAVLDPGAPARLVAAGEDGGQVRNPERPRLAPTVLGCGPPVAGEDPGSSVSRPVATGSLVSCGGSGSAGEELKMAHGATGLAAWCRQPTRYGERSGVVHWQSGRYCVGPARLEGELDRWSACPGTLLGPRTLRDETASEQDFEQRCRPGNGALSSLKASGGKGRGRRCVRRPLFEAPPGRVVNRGGWVGRKSLPPAGAEQIRGRSFDRAGGRRVDHLSAYAKQSWQVGSRVAAVSGLPRRR